METFDEIRSGMDLSRRTREFYSHLRKNNINPYDAERVCSCYNDIVERLKARSSFLEHVGYFFEQMKNLKESYANARYINDNWQETF